MLRRSFTAVLEKGATFSGEFSTEPYEAGWAHEARWFVRVLRSDERVGLQMVPQISPDGTEWCDEGSGSIRLQGAGLASMPIVNFGSWLRLRGTTTGRTGSVTVLIYLALKE
ncbi:MAG: hypothetical protein OXN97_02780 [Bryobacterales bacterium]|nr:hypothetical protein [Bryobacterales bacterium]MDE0625532.1 hypothetical protein [Bryobacterales bacterium]